MLEPIRYVHMFIWTLTLTLIYIDAHVDINIDIDIDIDVLKKILIFTLLNDFMNYTGNDFVGKVEEYQPVLESTDRDRDSRVGRPK